MPVFEIDRSSHSSGIKFLTSVKRPEADSRTASLSVRVVDDDATVRYRCLVFIQPHAMAL